MMSSATRRGVGAPTGARARPMPPAPPRRARRSSPLLFLSRDSLYGAVTRLRRRPGRLSAGRSRPLSATGTRSPSTLTSGCLPLWPRPANWSAAVRRPRRPRPTAGGRHPARVMEVWRGPRAVLDDIAMVICTLLCKFSTHFTFACVRLHCAAALCRRTGSLGCADIRQVFYRHLGRRS
jgi:hypothetical protein